MFRNLVGQLINNCGLKLVIIGLTPNQPFIQSYLTIHKLSGPLLVYTYIHWRN